MNSRTARGKTRSAFELNGAHLGLGLAALYAVGFLVANVHLGGYELLRTEPLRTRYVAAALLFIACSLMPVSAAILLIAVLSIRRRQRGEGESSALDPVLGRLSTVQLVLLELLAVGVYFATIDFISIDRSADAGRPITSFGTAYYFGLVYMMTAWAASYLLGLRTPLLGQRRATRLLTIAISSWFALLLPPLFGRTVYPVVQSQFGGGAAWIGRLEWSDSTALVARGFSHDSLVIIDHDERSVSVLSCSRESHVEVISFPAEGIAAIRLAREIVPGDFMDKCRATRGRP